MNRFTVHHAPQRSAEWFAARLGRLTGTAAADMLATIKSGEAAARRDLRTRLVCERLTHAPQDDAYTNAAMEWGVAHEDEARIAYEMQTSQNVQESGFLSLDGLMVGCSLDGHVGDYHGIVEIKCPFKTARHLAALKGIPAEYLPQITHNLWVSGAAWCDYVSYDPRLPGALRVVVHRVEATSLDLGEYERKVTAFLSEVETELAALMTMAGVSDRLTEALA